MALHESIKASIPEALKARDEVRLRVVRSLTTAMTNEVVAKKRKPDEFLADDEALVVIKRAANQRKDSIDQYEKGGRPELAEPEQAELSIIEEYLPAQMSREEVTAAAQAKISEMLKDSAPTKSDAGKIIGALMRDLKGRADGGIVKEVVDSLLS
jgi:uncharacterized protein YqeY